jgi:hypothetical protein
VKIEEMSEQIVPGRRGVMARCDDHALSGFKHRTWKM